MHVILAIKLLRRLRCVWAPRRRGYERLDMVCKERLLDLKKIPHEMIDFQIRKTGRCFYLVGKNEEDSKVFQHRTLSDHLQL